MNPLVVNKFKASFFALNFLVKFHVLDFPFKNRFITLSCSSALDFVVVVQLLGN